MKKILFIIDSLNGGGAEKILITYLRHIDASKFDVDLFLINKDGVFLEDVPNHINLFWAFQGNSFYTRIIRRISLTFPFLFYIFWIKNKYDIEIAFREDSSTRIILQSSNKKSKKISWLHTDLEKYEYYPTTPKRKYLKSLSRLNQIVCVSKTVEQILHKLNLDTRSITKVIYNPIDSEDIIYRSKLIDIAQIDKSKINLVTIGRIEECKNHSLLLECMPQLIKRNNNIHLWIVGTGSEMGHLVEHCQQCGINKHVHFTGFIKNPYYLLSCADIFVFSSIYEGLPTVLIEALVLQKKIISTFCGGAEEVLEHGRYGLLVNANIEEFCNGIIKILQNEALCDINFDNRVQDFALKTQCDLLNQWLDE